MRGVRVLLETTHFPADGSSDTPMSSWHRTLPDAMEHAELPHHRPRRGCRVEHRFRVYSREGLRPLGEYGTEGLYELEPVRDFTLERVWDDSKTPIFFPVRVERRQRTYTTL